MGGGGNEKMKFVGELRNDEKKKVKLGSMIKLMMLIVLVVIVGVFFFLVK